MFEWLPERIEQAKRVLQTFDLIWDFRLNPPATESEIQTCEAALGISLPPSYRVFLLHHNGACLFQHAADYVEEPGFTIYDTVTLVEQNHTYQVTYEDEWDSLVSFCDWGGCGDFCAFDFKQIQDTECAVLDCQHDSSSAQWRQAKIALSFSQWLEHLFDTVVDRKQHPCYWPEDQPLPLAKLRSEVQEAAMEVDVLCQKGREKAKRLDFAGAITNCEQALAICTQFPELFNKELVEIYRLRGEGFSGLGNYQAAIADFDQTLQINPRDILAYEGRAAARSALGDQQGALADLNQITQITANGTDQLKRDAPKPSGE